MTPTDARARSQQNLPDSAVEYESVDLTSADYVPSKPFRGFDVGGAGDVVIVGLAGKTITFKSRQAGCYYPFAGLSIVKTGTTATSITALF